jgi:acyl-coenzyme A thioesterase PaaI-like protein
MRLIHRSRQRHRGKAPRIEINQAEITADLHYPVSRRAASPPPIAVTMRLRPIELEEGRVVFEGKPGEEHYNPKVLYRGRKQATSEATLSAAESGKLLAHGMATCMILGG